MVTSPFLCLACSHATLLRTSEQLTCPACGTVYPLSNNVPVLLPSTKQQEAIVEGESQNISLDELQAIYDRAYEHDGLMGTDLDETYDRVTKQILLSFAEPLDGKRLLDVGTGVGKLWDYVTAGVEGYAFDLSTIGVLRATERHPNLTVSVSIAEYIPYPDNFFDAVLAVDTIEHTFSPLRALQEIHRVLEPGGIMSASFPTPDSLRKWGWNHLVHERPNVRLLVRLARVLVKRTLLFGRPGFQPIDRDYGLDEWVRMLETSGFLVDKVVTWPEPPKLPIVYLVRAIRG